jgi:hypothetical protein
LTCIKEKGISFQKYCDNLKVIKMINLNGMTHINISRVIKVMFGVRHLNKLCDIATYGPLYGKDNKTYSKVQLDW